MPNESQSTSLGVFKPGPVQGQPMFSSSKGLLFILIALTKLDKENGLFSALEGSHRQPQGAPKAEWNIQDLELSPGDAIIWRSNLALMPSNKGGGKFLRADFKIGA